MHDQNTIREPGPISRKVTKPGANAAKRRRWRGIVALGAGIILCDVSRADCASDCNSQYETAMSACQAMNPDPDSPNAIQACMDQAQQTLGACSAQCTESENDAN